MHHVEGTLSVIEMAGKCRDRLKKLDLSLDVGVIAYSAAYDEGVEFW